ncbi:ATP-binding protein [Nocardia asteroides]|uniref:ATP-binding protein n=1 Tax=Nocardia asteroides TaxID=1824 RepID=UPI001E2BE631|nr:ATP-binding protein [Nocardia asteroides]UGT55929.1 ATP-binding protein [Nocardia asteroides]
MTTPPPTVADRLRRARRRRFVGRVGEVELFRTALDAEEPPFTVLFLHGPGGIGKTALLTELRDVAVTAGIRTVWTDGRTADPTPAAFQHVVEPGDSEFVLFVDTFERLTPLESWLREDFLPGLPTRALVVVAGRNPPAPAWTADSGWQELLRVISLRNLAPDDARAYLRAAGVAESSHERILTLTHGHPLALSLLVDVVRQTSADLPASLLEAPDAVRALLARFVDSVPGPAHRSALEVCAHVRHTTEALLRAAIGEAGSAEVFEWLRGLAIMEHGPLGLAPHDIARDVLDADLRWRDPSAYLDIHQRIRAHLLEQLDGAAHDTPPVADLVFLHRHNPTISGYWDWSSFGRAFPDRFRSTDREAILAMTKRHQGLEQAELVEFWLERQPERFVAVRESGSTPIGFFCRLALHEATEADLTADPGTRTMWDHATRYGRTTPDEPVYAGRFLVDAQADQRPSPTMNTVTAFSTHAWLSQRGVAWDFIGAFAESESWEPFMRHIDFHHADGYTIGARRYAVYAHDWRRVGVAQWLDLTNDRVLGAPLARPAPPEPELVLSHQEFVDAVRAALRDMKRGARLDRNPLLRSRVVRSRPGAATGQELRALITETAESLCADPRGAKLHRVLDRTFLRPAPTQELAAAMLDLPFSTYRRHLTQGIERVAAELWERELYRPGAAFSG